MNTSTEATRTTERRARVLTELADGTLVDRAALDRWIAARRRLVALEDHSPMVPIYGAALTQELKR